ncbi:MAG: SCO family protein [Acidimicrobiia bacterium]
MRKIWAMAGLFVVLLNACGGEANTKTSRRLRGLVRTPLLNVRHVQLPEATVGDERSVFPMHARSDGLLIMYFGYTHCPDICPTSLAALRRAYIEIDSASSRIDTAMVTVDPERDTGEVLTTYLQNFFEENYHALRTTDTAALERAETPFLAKSSVTPGALTESHDHVMTRGEPVVEHTGTTYAVDDKGRVVVEWPFGTEAKAIAHDLRILLDVDAGKSS